MRWVVLVFGLTVPAGMALVDCLGRDPDAFDGGAEGRRAWVVWLVVATATAWLLVGNAVVLSYYWAVVKRAPAMGPPPRRP